MSTPETFLMIAFAVANVIAWGFLGAELRLPMVVTMLASITTFALIMFGAGVWT